VLPGGALVVGGVDLAQELVVERVVAALDAGELDQAGAVQVERGKEGLTFGAAKEKRRQAA
jgi:hypothetical protein